MHRDRDEIDKILDKKLRELMREMIEKSGESIEEVVYKVNDHTFISKVIERSFEKPVIVDFWAPWCGPCRILGPAIERAVKRFNGGVLLAKLNVDENPLTAAKYGVMSIPTVIMFRNGKPIEHFIGALPENLIIEWIKRNV